MHNDTVILVEHQEEVRAAFKKLLRESLFEVVDFNNSMSAIQWLKQNGKPKLLILEGNSSPLNGWQTLNYLDTEIGREYPVIMEIEPDTKTTDGRLLGFVTKPYTEETILTIARFLDSVWDCEVSQKRYSLGYLEILGGGNQSFIQESIKIFEDSVAMQLMHIQKALDNENLKEVRDIAHNIKPSFEMLSNKKGTRLCNVLAHTAKDGELSQMAMELKTEFEAVLAQITSDFTKSKIK